MHSDDQVRRQPNSEDIHADPEQGVRSNQPQKGSIPQHRAVGFALSVRGPGSTLHADQHEQRCCQGETQPVQPEDPGIACGPPTSHEDPRQQSARAQTRI